MPCATFARAILGATFVLLLHLAPVQAQFARIVSVSGDDTNFCQSPADACRTLQRAHDIGGPGEKIVVLDSGNYGSVVITEPVAIVATGVHANLFFGVVTKIIINAGPDDVIDIDGLAIGTSEGFTAPSSGIEFNSGRRLNVRNCTIRNFNTAGIHIKGSDPSQVFISDCTITDNRSGVLVQAGNRNVSVFLDRVTVEGNTGAGVSSQGSGARVRISNSTITHNGAGIRSVNGGRLISFGNNAINGNRINGAPTTTVVLK